MKRLFCVCVSVLGAVCVAGAPSAWANSLENELAQLLRSHPGIAAAVNTTEAADQEITKAEGAYWPSVDLTAEMGPEFIDSPSERVAEDHEKKISTRTKKTTTLTITENVFNGYLTESNVNVAKLGRDSFNYQQKTLVQQTFFEGASAYVNVLRNRRLIELAQSNEMNIKEQLNLEDERVKRGAGIAVDVLQAKSRLQLGKERRVAFEGQLEDSVSRYTQVFDHGPDMVAMTDPSLPIDLIPETLEEAIEIARRENPTVTGAMVAIDGAKERKNQARAGYFPTVDVVGTWNYEEDNNSTIGIRRDYSVILSASWNLFNGFATQAGETRAAFDYAAAKDTHILTIRKAEEQTRLAWQVLTTSQKRVALLENAVNLAAEVFDARKKLKEAGKETVINVLDSENELYSRQIDYTSASYDEQLAVFQLLLAMGRLSPEFLGLNPS